MAKAPGSSTIPGWWFADGGRVLVMRNDGDANLSTVDGAAHIWRNLSPDERAGHRQARRTNASVGTNRSAWSKTDWHRQAEDSLMREVAGDLLADLGSISSFPRSLSPPHRPLGTLSQKGDER